MIIPAVFGSGCIGGDYIANHDVIIVKLGPDGSTCWTATIDKGYDDYANDMIPVSDGGCLVAVQHAYGRFGPYNSSLVLFSPDGNLKRDFIQERSDMEFNALVQTGDGEIAALTKNGILVRFNRDGNVLWESNTGIGEATAVITTSDGGFAIAGRQQDSIPFGSVAVYDSNGTVSSRDPLPGEPVVTPGCHETVLKAGDEEIAVTECTVPVDIIHQAAVARLDKDGKVIWKKAYGGAGITGPGSITERPDGSGFILTGYEEVRDMDLNTTDFSVAALLDPGGNVIYTKRVDPVDYFTRPQVYESEGGYDILYVNTTLKDGHYNYRRVEAHLDPDSGEVISRRFIGTGIVMMKTDEGGYFTAGLRIDGVNKEYDNVVYRVSEDNHLYAGYYNPDGSRLWDQEIEGISPNSVKKVARSSDGGYFILAMKENY